MNGLTIIYIIGALAIGFLVGIIVELMIDSQTVRDLQEQNKKLRLEVAQAKKNPEVIEIYDKWNVNAKEPDEEVTFPNTSGF